MTVRETQLRRVVNCGMASGTLAPRAIKPSPAYNPVMKARVFVVACLLSAVLVAADAFGCPTCKDGIAATDAEGANLARGYFYSILLMLAMPLTLVSSFGAYVWREMRRQQRQSGPHGDGQSFVAVDETRPVSPGASQP